MKTKNPLNQMRPKTSFLSESEKLEFLLFQRLECKTEFEFGSVDVREELAKKLERGRSKRNNLPLKLPKPRENGSF
jgi:hypothetical protein